MNSKKSWDAVGRIYDNVEAALWTLLIIFLIYFITFLVPKMPQVWARNERIRVQEIAAEQEAYCAKLGIEPGTAKYAQCLLVLSDFRSKIEKRIAEENELF